MPDTKHLHVLRARMFWATVVLSIAVLISFSFAAWSFKVSHDAARRERGIICTAQNRSNDAIRKVLTLAQTIAASRPDASPAERQARADFYGRALRLVGPVPCIGTSK